jgi:uncharacterized repeat protein (TIGR01451 family)
MKKLTLLFLVLVLKFAPAKAQWVTIPDANFVTWLTASYPSCMNGNQMDTTCSGIVNETTIYVSGNNINDLNGIQYFDNATSLNCSNNLLSNLPSFTNKLTFIDCSVNQLISLPSLPDSLLILNCGGNQLTALPIMPNFMNVLECGHNQLTVLPLIPPSIFKVDCSFNQLTFLPPLPNSINFFSCSNNQISSLTFIPGVVMGAFNISNNNFHCIDNLPLIDMWSGGMGDISNNFFTCVPNQTDYSLGLPLCVDNDISNNPNICQSAANITGKVFKDLDNDCAYFNTDWITENIPVCLFDNQNNLIAVNYAINGIYAFASLQPDTFYVKINDLDLPITMDCGQTNTETVVLENTNQYIADINFSVICDSVFDLKIHSVSRQGLAFPGQLHALNSNIANDIIWYNLNCANSTFSGTVAIDVNGPVSYVSPSASALTPQVNGNIFTYTITDFNTLTPTSFGLQFLTDTNAQAGDQICVHVEISTNQIDADTTNNVYDFCYNVVNSYDPNMKEVYPVNVLPGYDDWFTYTIHFQNTGNAPSFNIRLRDTLDANLDINSFEVRGYSHPANISLNGNILTVRFNNIMLPDSTSDYEGSMGYFQYRLKPLPNLPNGSQIRNTAYIYFDYNAPIVTNTTENNFDITLPVKSLVYTENSFSLYPNPSTGVFIFKDTKNLNSVEVYSIVGEKILSQTNQKTINLNGFSKGIYFARVNGGVVLKMVKE